MGKATNFAMTTNWAYTPDFKTIQISTKRAPAMSGLKKGNHVAHLSGVESSPLILSSAETTHRVMQALGLDGTAVKLWQLRLHKTPHVDDGVAVDQLPDVKESDLVVVDSVEYPVIYADTPHRFSFGEILLVYVHLDKRE